MAHKDSHYFGKKFEAVSGQQENDRGPLAMPSVGTRRTRGRTFKVFAILKAMANSLMRLWIPSRQVSCTGKYHSSL